MLQLAQFDTCNNGKRNVGTGWKHPLSISEMHRMNMTNISLSFVSNSIVHFYERNVALRLLLLFFLVL